MADNMEVANLVTKISIEDSGVEKSMAQLARQMKVVESEFKAASARLGEHANSQEALRIKADALNKQMEIQGQRIVKLKQQHEEAANSKGKDAKETQNLETRLNKAVAQYNKLHGELQKTTAEIDKQSSAWNKVSKQLDAAAKKMESIGQKMKSAGQEMSLMITAPLAAVGTAGAKASIDYETAFAGVRKTVDATEAEFKQFSDQIREMSKEIPAAATSIAGVAEAAGQLGVKKESIMGFTRTMTDLGVATNMAATDAATALARLANITQMPQDNFDRLGATIVALGNNLATTESEIVDMSLRLAGAGKQIGMTEAQILSFAGSLSSVGIEAEMGGSAFSRVMIDMANAAMMGGDSLKMFAAVAGMSSADFKKQFEKDATSALISFIEGLDRMSKAGENTFLVLDKLGLSEIRVRDTLLRASGAGDLFRNSIELGSKAWQENTALTDEANERYKTTASQLQMLGNRIVDAAITFGDALVPAIMAVLDSLEPLFVSIEQGATWFASLDESGQKTVLTLVAIVAAAGPLLIVVGKLVESVGLLIPVIKGLGTALMWLSTNPIGLVLMAIAGAVTLFFSLKNSMAEAKAATEELAQAQENLQLIQQNGITREEVEATQAKIDKLNELIETYQKVIDTASASNSAQMGNNVLALDTAVKELDVDMKELEKTANEFGVTLEFVDDNGKLTARSMNQLRDAQNTLTKAVKDAKRETTAEINESAKQLATRKQEVVSLQNLVNTYKTAKKGSADYKNAQSELAKMFPHLNTATGLNIQAIEGLIATKNEDINLTWANIQLKAREAKQETDTAIAKQQAAIKIAEGIVKITGESGIAEAALSRMNDQLDRLRGEAASLQQILDMKPDDFKIDPVVITPINIPGGSGGGGKSKGTKTPKTPKAAAYENKALDEAYKQLEHKKRLDQMTLESELKTLEQIKAKHVKTADERMEIEERLYDVRKAIGDRTLANALDDLDKSKRLGKLTEDEEIARLKRIKKQYSDSAEERKQIDDMIFDAELRRQEAIKKKIEDEKQLRKETTDYVSQQLQAAYEDRLAREELSAEEQYKLQDRLLNDQIYLNNNYLKKVLADTRYTADEKKKIEREVTEAVRKQTNDRLKLQREYNESVKKLQEDEKKARIESINNLSKGVQDALRAKYQEEKRVAEESIRDAQQANEEWKKSQLDAIKTVYDARVESAQRAADAEIAAIESTYNARIEAIQRELDALDQAEKKKTREELDAEDAKKISRLQGLIEYEHDEFNRAQLQKELNKVLAEQAERHRQEQLQEHKDALKSEQDELKNKQKEEIDAVKQQLAAKKEIMQAEYEAQQANINAIYAAQKASLDQQLIDTQNHYNQLLNAKNLQAEAEKMIVQKQQEEILKLLEDFGDSYNVAGQSLGEQFYKGFESEVMQIQSLIDSITSQISAARSAAVAAMSLASEVAANTNDKQPASSNSPSSSNGPIRGTVVSVTQNFNAPVTSPSDVSRAGTKAAQQLAMGL
ncbi:phage tail tape measure protein [Paenibacillus sp. FSL W8-1287]|uniref:phage tail tape measure protein n=1 Tax=Paenibacillus sp. FSL W8-1287 TaxID=2954653 RepID=UPI0030D41C5D